MPPWFEVGRTKGPGTTPTFVTPTPESRSLTSSTATSTELPRTVTPRSVGGSGDVLPIAAIIAIVLGAAAAFLLTVLLLNWVALKLGVRLS